MRTRSIAIGGTLMLLWAGAAQGQDMLDGNSVDAILELARSHGTAKLTTLSNGDPVIRAVMDGIRYEISFMNCTNNTDCADLNFYTGFSDLKPGIEVMNEWNATKRFGKAYTDNVGDANVEWDINVEFGISRENLDAAFLRWGQVMDQFSRYIGWQ